LFRPRLGLLRPGLGLSNPRFSLSGSRFSLFSTGLGLRRPHLGSPKLGFEAGFLYPLLFARLTFIRNHRLTRVSRRRRVERLYVTVFSVHGKLPST
jgi:hypothetical protein